MDAGQLKAIYPLATDDRINQFLAPLNVTLDIFDISTPKRAAAFLGQVGVESGQLRYTKEIWGPTDWQLRYETMASLGNNQPGDGERYMGRGLIQITGRLNYRLCGQALEVDFENQPELMQQPDWAARSAGWYWKSRACNVPADVGDIRRITKLVNGGLNGYADRVAITQRALQVLGG